MSETASEQGMVDEAQKVLEEAEALKKLTPRQEPAVDPTKYTAADTDQKLRLCDICGAFLSIYDRLSFFTIKQIKGEEQRARIK
ncbi:putative RNA-binding protein Luc7-like 1 isoform X2 [Brassica napus]|uniref:putative RNA-binding protein Luc7-like 1 isoform X2 n=1 Tax=Brassica napus TaxID=3708 RepID=UPI002078C894|nr:putative RNA-binding protein Luc7-like 1 isoform X2 [Brassica napus]